MIFPDRGGQEVIDSLDMIGHFGFSNSCWVESNHEGTCFLYWTGALVLAKDNWLKLWYEVTVLLLTSLHRVGPEAADSLDTVKHFSYCTPTKLNIITKVLSDLIELKLWFLPKTINCKDDTRLLSCFWLSQTLKDRKLLIVLTWQDTSVSALLLSWI